MALFSVLYKKIFLLNQATATSLKAHRSERILGNGACRLTYSWENAKWARFFCSAETLNYAGCTQTEPVNSVSQKKILRVAIMGRPNAGKSTLINSILKLNVCDASPKTHTTSLPLKTSFIRGDTQIVFIDTPGIVTKKELSRFKLEDSFLQWKDNVYNEIDIIGVIHEVLSSRDITKLPLNLIQNIYNIPKTVPLFIILNKIDMVLDKKSLSEAVAKVANRPKREDDPLTESQRVWDRFCKIFLVSALQNLGVEEIVDFLLEQAKPGDWVFQPYQISDRPLHVLVKNLLRAQIMHILPNEIPYNCDYEVEYMEENDLGEVICVALVLCQKNKYFQMLVRKRKSSLKQISRKLESDLFKILGKVFRLRIVVYEKEKLTKKNFQLCKKRKH